MDLNYISNFAKEIHEKTGCKYDNKNYYYHIKMVEDGIDKYKSVFKSENDYFIGRASASCHDLMEDCRLTFNDIKKETNIFVAHVVSDVTDVHEENRLLRHLATMGKTIKNHISIIVKLCDIRANALYSKTTGSSMYQKYMAEYNYRKPIFKMALSWYNKVLNQDVLDKLWNELDEIHEFNK